MKHYGEKKIKLAGPGAYARTLPYELLVKIMNDSKQFAEMHGKNVQLFRKNKVTIDFEKVNYDIVKLHETLEYGDFEEQVVIAVNNPYQLKIRPEKQIAKILGLSRSQVKNLLDKGKIELKMELPQVISISINPHLHESCYGNRHGK